MSNENGVSFCHMTLGRGKCTAAFILDENRDADRRMLEVAYAYCSPRDQFKKSMARHIARERLRKGKTMHIEFAVDHEASLRYQVTQQLYAGALEFNNAPKWAFKKSKEQEEMDLLGELLQKYKEVLLQGLAIVSGPEDFCECGHCGEEAADAQLEVEIGK